MENFIAFILGTTMIFFLIYLVKLRDKSSSPLPNNWKKSISYKIMINNNSIGIEINQLHPELPTIEYIRLWTCFLAKMLHALNYPNNPNAKLTLHTIKKIIATDLNSNTDCFENAELKTNLKFTAKPPSDGKVITGDFLGQGSTNRITITDLPVDLGEENIIYSCIAMMQVAINKNAKDIEALKILSTTTKIFIMFCESTTALDIEDIIRIPQISYMQAINAIN